MKMKKPTAREYQYEKPFCLIERNDCFEIFVKIGKFDYPQNCSNCKVAFEHKNMKKEKK